MVTVVGQELDHEKLDAYQIELQVFAWATHVMVAKFFGDAWGSATECAYCLYALVA